MSPQRATQRKPVAARPAAGKVAGISDAAVRAATGHGWEHWLRALRRAGAEG